MAKSKKKEEENSPVRIYLVGGPACGNEYELSSLPEEFNVALVPIKATRWLAPTAAVPVNPAAMRRAIYMRDGFVREDLAWRFSYGDTVGAGE